MKFRITMSALVLAGLCAAGTGFAADAKTQPAKAPDAARSPSPDEMKWMDWMQKNVPGDAHKLLASCVGEWNLEVKSWMDPKAPPMVSKATSSVKLILDGRYLQETSTGTMAGAPFNGMGLTAYDNGDKKYQATWVDNMSTEIFRFDGTYDLATKSLTMDGASYSPVAAKDVPMKTVTRFVDDKSHVFEWWAPGPGGDMFKAMEITYTRQ